MSHCRWHRGQYEVAQQQLIAAQGKQLLVQDQLRVAQGQLIAAQERTEYVAKELERERQGHQLASELVSTLQRQQERTNSELGGALREVQRQEELLSAQVERLKRVEIIHAQEISDLAAETQTLHTKNTQLGRQVSDLEIGLSSAQRTNLDLTSALQIERDENEQLLLEKNRLENSLRLARAQNLDSQAYKSKMKLLAPTYFYLQQINSKAKRLEEDGFGVAAKKAYDLITAIYSELDEFIAADQPDELDVLDTLKENCKAHIKVAESVLGEHRGWKRVLGNLMACVLGLGVGYVAAGLINLMINQRFTFFNQTDSMRQVNELHEQIESLTVVSPV